MTKVIGLTGGIGSGKTTVARLFSELGVPVYIADDAGREVTGWPVIQSRLRSVFGAEIFPEDKLDRKRLASIVFNDKARLEELNAIVHPAVAQHFTQWKRLHSDKAFVIREAAILFESGSYKDCDKIITVTAPLEVRIARVMQRDNATREQVIERMKNQWTDGEKIALSDFVIENADLQNTRQQVVKIFKTLQKL